LTEIANRDESAVDAVPASAQPLVSHALVQWAQGARAAHQIAQSLAGTPFVPDSFGNNVANVTAAILVGQEVGLEPMAALRSMDIVKGTPALRAVAMRALVQSHGHEVWTVEKTATRVVMRGRRAGSSTVEESEWTMDRAKQLGVGGGTNYQKQPMTMLIARATSEVCRLIAADVLLGIPYSAEELDDGLDLGGEQVAAPAKRTRTAKRALLTQVPLPEPDPTPEPLADVADNTDASEPDPDPDWPDVAQPPKDGAT
jgi:hypothetical protein